MAIDSGAPSAKWRVSSTRQVSKRRDFEPLGRGLVGQHFAPGDQFGARIALRPCDILAEPRARTDQIVDAVFLHESAASLLGADQAIIGQCPNGAPHCMPVDAELVRQFRLGR